MRGQRSVIIMPLVPAICTQCKGALQVDPNQKSGVCPFCGTQFVSQDLINNYNITNVQNTVTNIGNLHAENVTIQDSKSADNLYKKAVTYLNFKDYNSALTAFDEMTKTYPYDHRGWKGMILAYTRNLDKTFFTDANTVNWVKYYYDLYVKAKNYSGIVINNDPTDKYLAFAKKCLEENVNKKLELDIAAAIQNEQSVGSAGKENAKKELESLKKRKAELEKLKKKSPARRAITYSVIALIVAVIPSLIAVALVFADYGESMSSIGLSYEEYVAHIDFWWDIPFGEIFCENLTHMLIANFFSYWLIWFLIFLIPVAVITIIKAVKNDNKYSKEKYESVLKQIKGKELLINGAYDSISAFALEDTIKRLRENAANEINKVK